MKKRVFGLIEIIGLGLVIDSTVMNVGADSLSLE